MVSNAKFLVGLTCNIFFCAPIWYVLCNSLSGLNRKLHQGHLILCPTFSDEVYFTCWRKIIDICPTNLVVHGLTYILWEFSPRHYFTLFFLFLLALISSRPCRNGQLWGCHNREHNRLHDKAASPSVAPNREFDSLCSFQQSLYVLCIGQSESDKSAHYFIDNREGVIKPQDTTPSSAAGLHHYITNYKFASDSFWSRDSAKSNRSSNSLNHASIERGFCKFSL